SSAPSAAARARCHRRLGRTVADHALAQRPGITSQRFVEPTIRILHPPGEQRIVPIVITIPAADDAAELIDVLRRAVRYHSGDAWRGWSGLPRGPVARGGSIRRGLERRPQTIHLTRDLRYGSRRRPRVGIEQVAT